MGCGTCKSCDGGPCQGLLPEAELPTNLPLVVYDGDCSFCRRWLKRYESICPPQRVAWSPYQKAAGSFPGIPESQFSKAMHLIHPDGHHTKGAHAVFELMKLVDLRTWPLVLYRFLIPFRWICDALYHLVSNHRTGANLLAKVAWGPLEVPSTTLLTRRLFLRMLGVIFLIAFLSLGWQMNGLIGPEGLQPANELLGWLDARNASSPSLLQLSSSDGLMSGLWWAGTIASAMVIVGLVPMLTLAIAWVIYLSFMNAGGLFMSYQWDSLLLEVGFLSIFWAPFSWRLNGRGVRRPSTLLRWMFLWLLMRFMFFSGWVKLASGDPTWMDLTAIDYHYWTQPLPWWPAWYAWQLPLWSQKLSCVLMFIIEMGIPFLLLFPRVPRLIAFGSLAALQIGIVLTGNYGFFNWLTLVLCIVALDDSQLLWLWPKRVRGMVRVGMPRQETIGRRGLNLLVASLVLSLSIPIAVSQLSSDDRKANGWSNALGPYRIANPYGLFRVMTKSRPEIIIEGSLDGVTWSAYEFNWKPGPLMEAPGLSQPDMPRLDWQMWFDALKFEYAIETGSIRLLEQISKPDIADPDIEVFTTGLVTPRLCKALLRDNQEVIQLLRSSPFGEEPPRMIRWSLYRYTFTTPEEASGTGDWWKRDWLYTSPIMTQPGGG